MDISFKESSRRKKNFKYLTFLPKNLRQIGLYGLIFNLLSIIISLVFYPPLQTKIPLFYSLPENQQLVDKKTIFFLPILASLISATHFFIIKKFKNAHPTILQVFLLSTTVIQFLIFAILLRLIIILN
jgi:uncharacterized membrane protein